MLKLGSRIVAFGECMVELRRQSGPLMVQSFGGDTLNTATYLTRLAGKDIIVHYATALGDADSFSQAMVDSWIGEGIGIAFIRRLKNRLPGIYTIDVDDKGERTFAYWRDNSAARYYFDAPATPLDTEMHNFDVFYFSGISLAILSPEYRARLFVLIETMRGHGKTIIFDNNYRARLWNSSDAAKAAYHQAYRLADIALVTLSDEMERENYSSEYDAIAKTVSLPSPELVIKRGANSTLVRNALGQVTEIEVEKVDNVVDTTAAGDSFGAGYIAARMRAYAPKDAASIGNRLAGAVIQYPGAIIPREKMPVLFT